MKFLLAFALIIVSAAPVYADFGDSHTKKIKALCSERRSPEATDKPNFWKPTLNPAVTELGPGHHELYEGSEVTIYADNSYMLVLSPAHTGAMGSGYAKDYRAINVIGGCTLEQLSETLKSNKIILTPKDESAAAAAEVLPAETVPAQNAAIPAWKKPAGSAFKKP